MQQISHRKIYVSTEFKIFETFAATESRQILTEVCLCLSLKGTQNLPLATDKFRKLLKTGLVLKNSSAVTATFRALSFAEKSDSLVE